MGDTEIVRDGRVVRVRDTGDPDGPAVMYFHGTPGSRLDISFGDQLAAGRGVRLVSFDRPGYGGSAPAPFGLASVAADAHAIADQLGIARFATLGLSGGGPGALAAASVGGGRVTRAGVASGAGPFQEVPGALEGLDSNDRDAVALLPGDPAGAAAAFAAGFEPLAELSRASGGAAVVSAFESALSQRDKELLADPRFAATFAGTMQEALRRGTSGGGWDNVSWVGTWDIDLSAIRCPVLLWYGRDDRMAPPEHGRWLAEHLPDAHLVLRDGEGHFGIYDHLGEMLDALTQPGPPDPAGGPRP
jgi:pimeloyl-ACP methyl ester carboxylesterase